MTVSIIAGDLGTIITVQNKKGPKKIDPAIDLTLVSSVFYKVKKPNPCPALPGTFIEVTWNALVEGDPLLGYISYQTVSWARSNLAGQTGVAARLDRLEDPRVEDEVLLSGLTGMTVNSIGNIISLTNSDRDGEYWITGFVDPTLVRVKIPGIMSALPEHEKIKFPVVGPNTSNSLTPVLSHLDSHNGEINWQEIKPAGGDTDVPGSYFLQPNLIFDGPPEVHVQGGTILLSVLPGYSV